MSWQQFCRSLAFTEGWVIPLPLSWTDFSLLWFSMHEWPGWRSRSVISCKESGLTAVDWYLTVQAPFQCTRPCFSLLLCSSGIPGWSFVWRSLYPGTCSSQLLPLSCARDTAQWCTKHWAAVLDFARWRHGRVLWPKVKLSKYFLLAKNSHNFESLPFFSKKSDDIQLIKQSIIQFTLLTSLAEEQCISDVQPMTSPWQWVALVVWFPRFKSPKQRPTEQFFERKCSGRKHLAHMHKAKALVLC